MTRKTVLMTDELHQYLLGVSLREPELLRRLREETARMAQASMQIAPEQGQFMALLVNLIGARRCLEVGVFTGYSSLAVALALPAGGQLVACDMSEEWTQVARRYWCEAGVEDKVDLRLGPAVATLDGLLEAGEGGRFDFAFIDADKREYADYYERLLQLLRPGGLIAIDNVLWGGSVVDASDQSEDTRAIREFNAELLADQRVDLSLVPMADGITLARKR